MFFYIAIIILLMLLSIGRLGNIKPKTVLRIAMVLLWFIATVRSLKVGNDTQNYYNIFTSISKYHNLEIFSTRYEIGYLWLNELISHLTNNFWIFLAIVNTIIYYAYYKFIDMYSENPMMSVFLFFVLGIWGQTVNIIRLQLALAMMIYAFLLKEKRKILLCVICMVLAVSFQRISLIYAIGFIVPPKITKKGYVVAAMGTAVAYVLVPSIMSWVAGFIPYFSTYFSSSTYIIDDTKMASVISLLIRLFVFVFGLYVYIHLSENEKEVNSTFALQINMVFIAMMMMTLSLRFNLLDRCGYFFWLFAIVMLPNAIKRMKIESNRLIIMGLLIGVCILYFVVINVYRPSWNHIYPYSSIFF
jgi:hypothetical protein